MKIQKRRKNRTLKISYGRKKWGRGWDLSLSFPALFNSASKQCQHYRGPVSKTCIPHSGFKFICAQFTVQSLMPTFHYFCLDLKEKSAAARPGLELNFPVATSTHVVINFWVGKTLPQSEIQHLYLVKDITTTPQPLTGNSSFWRRTLFREHNTRVHVKWSQSSRDMHLTVYFIIHTCIRYSALPFTVYNLNYGSIIHEQSHLYSTLFKTQERNHKTHTQT